MNNPTATFLLLQRLFKKYRQRPQENPQRCFGGCIPRSGVEDWIDMCEAEFDCHDYKLNEQAYKEYQVESKKRIGKRRFKNRKGI
jgi:hypothetical protein